MRTSDSLTFLLLPNTILVEFKVFWPTITRAVLQVFNRTSCCFGGGGGTAYVFFAGADAEWDARAMINGGDAANGASPLHLAAAVSHKEMVRCRQPSCPLCGRSFMRFFPTVLLFILTPAVSSTKLMDCQMFLSFSLCGRAIMRFMYDVIAFVDANRNQIDTLDISIANWPIPAVAHVLQGLLDY